MHFTPNLLASGLTTNSSFSQADSLTQHTLKHVPKSSRPMWRHPLIVGVCVSFFVLLLIGVLSRQPLSLTEKRLIGTWRNVATNVTFTFHSNRQVTRSGLILPHIWKISDGRLYTQTPLSAASRLFQRGKKTSLQITFNNDDNITAVYPRNIGTAYWQRVPDEVHSSSQVSHVTE